MDNQFFDMASVKFLLAFLTAGGIGGIIGVIISGNIKGKQENKERIFKAKFEAYKIFFEHLLNQSISVEEIVDRELKPSYKGDAHINFTKISSLGAGSIMVGNDEINIRLKAYCILFEYVFSTVYNGFSLKKTKIINPEIKEKWDVLHGLGVEISFLMREDLGFSKEKSPIKINLKNDKLLDWVESRQNQKLKF
jgi:hypothetical protein